MLKTLIVGLQDYGRKVKSAFAPNFERDMSNGFYFVNNRQSETGGIYLRCVA